MSGERDCSKYHMDYCVLNFTTPGKSCSFIMTDASHFTRCSEDMKRPSHHMCLMMGLTPGATYMFGIISETAGTLEHYSSNP